MNGELFLEIFPLSSLSAHVCLVCSFISGFRFSTDCSSAIPICSVCSQGLTSDVHFQVYFRFNGSIQLLIKVSKCEPTE